MVEAKHKELAIEGVYKSNINGWIIHKKELGENLKYQDL
jgi:hypothetical protein